MKIGIATTGQDHIDAYGGLELRFLVQWAHFLKSEGYDVHYFDPYGTGCDKSFDLAIGCLVERCENIHAKVHVHSSFNTLSLAMSGVQNNQCYKSGRFIYANPYRFDYLKSIGMCSSQGFKHIPIFMPIPYTDDLLPNNLRPGFQRTGIAWANKGNFYSEFGPDCRPHFVENGLRTLRALVRLNKRADFKITFLLDSHIRNTRPEFAGEIEALIGSFSRVERLDRIPWTSVVDLLSKCKLNTHAGGLTSCINETIFTHGVPVTPANFIHLATLDLLPDPTLASEDQIYDTYERLWFDEKFYLQAYEAFQDHFRDHRTDGVRRAWKFLTQQLDLE